MSEATAASPDPAGTIASDVGPGAASGLRLLRRLWGALFVAIGLLLACCATLAFRFELSLPEPSADRPPAVGPDVGDDRPFAPCVFAELGPIRGDEVTLAAALDAASDAGAELLVVHGPLVERADGAAAVVDVLREALLPVLPLASSAADGSARGVHDDVDPRLTRWLHEPEAWTLVVRGCVLRSGDDAPSLEGVGQGPELRLARTRAPSPGRLRFHRLDATGGISREDVLLAASAGPSAWLRRLALGPLLACGRSPLRYALSLGAALLYVLLGLRWSLVVS